VENSNVEELYVEAETLDELLFEIPRLPPMEALVLYLWCGLHGGDMWTMQRIAECAGLSRQQIQNYKDQAIMRLRVRARVYEPRS
jgi:DNA-directed RNA polymerase sigma subunit (sigma70/sigma32)